MRSVPQPVQITLEIGRPRPQFPERRGVCAWLPDSSCGAQISPWYRFSPIPFEPSLVMLQTAQQALRENGCDSETRQAFGAADTSRNAALGDRVEPSFSPRMASQQAPQRQRRASPPAMPRNRHGCVFRAGRQIPASSAHRQQGTTERVQWRRDPALVRAFDPFHLGRTTVRFRAGFRMFRGKLHEKASGRCRLNDVSAKS